MNALVIAPNWIGDALMAQPLLRLLHQHDTGLALDVLAPPATAPVFRMMPEVREVIEARMEHGKLQWALRRALARSLRQRGYQRAYVLPNSAKSALIPWLAGIPERIGHRGEFRYGLLNRFAPIAPAGAGHRPLMTEHYAQLAASSSAATGSASASAAIAQQCPDAPRLSPDPALIATTLERFGLSPAQALLVLCPGAEYGPAKRWPARHFAALADLACAQIPGLQIVLLGGKADRDVATDIATLSAHPLHNLCGQTSLAEAFALISAASGVVSNDSGLMHAAAAFDRPMAAVFGSTDPQHTPPQSPRAEVVSLGLSCSPCFQRECPLKHLRCLNDLAPQRVWQALATRMQPATL